MAPSHLSRDEFRSRLGAEVATIATADALFEHYRELVRWNASLSLVGPGDADRLVERHFLDSIRGSCLVGPNAAVAVDVGSGGGFPGLVLAAALPHVAFTLVESRQKKWAFLKRAASVAGLEVRCIHGSVGAALPDGLPQDIDLVTIRALRLATPTWQSLISRLTTEGRVLVWAGVSSPEMPADLVLQAEVAAPGSENRRILCYGRAPG